MIINARIKSLPVIESGAIKVPAEHRAISVEMPNVPNYPITTRPPGPRKIRLYCRMLQSCLQCFGGVA